MEILKHMESAINNIEKVKLSFAVGSIENVLLNEAIVQLRITKGMIVQNQLGIQL